MSAFSPVRSDQELFDAVFDQSRTAMLVVDADQVIVRANDAAALLTGHPVHMLQGASLDVLRLPNDRSALVDVWAQARATGSLTGVRQLLRADGTTIPVRWSATTRLGGEADDNLIVYLPTAEPRADVASTPHRRAPRLTMRQREIITLIALGLDSHEIAARLFITNETVRTHVRNAMRITGAHNRAHLVAMALQRGWIVDLD